MLSLLGVFLRLYEIPGSHFLINFIFNNHIVKRLKIPKGSESIKGQTTNGQKKKGKRANNDLEHIHRILNIEYRESN